MKIKRVTDALACVLNDEQWHDIKELYAAGRPCVSAERALRLSYESNRTKHRPTEQRAVRRAILAGERRVILGQLYRWKQQGLLESSDSNGQTKYKRIGDIPLRDKP